MSITTEFRTITKFVTEDGQEHPTIEAARQHQSNSDMLRELDRSTIYWRENVDTQEVVNWITSNKDLVRQHLDTCDAAMASVQK